ncbi:TOM1-like protein 2 [Sinocyclocheilus rhinocerous]|uniref:TOM1-like protein 2 n=1 Tax=Sinocyclocheilus rhinocerous TaxID=307959 RepID=UPI0007B8583A|nr:PREDICTED: TOM1-like protein 2 [Sinocyclocheilus rhinocerous]
MEFLLGNPYSSPVGQCIEKATDGSLQSEDWTLNMEICDIVNETEEGPKDAMRAVKKRLNGNRNFREVMLALTVLETCVKNCGHRFHIHVANRDFIEGVLVKIITPKSNPPAIVQDKVLSLIQAWADAFRSCPDLTGVVHIYKELKRKGIEFPMADLDALSPIHTPQRGVPEVDPGTHKYRAPSQPNTASQTAPTPAAAAAATADFNPTQIPTVSGPITANPEQVTQVLNEASEEDNLIDLGPGSPAVVTPRVSATPTSTLQPPAAAAASLSTQLAGQDVGADSVPGTLSSLTARNPQDDFDMFAHTRSSSLADQRKNVKYEEPQALVGLASALDIRQQNATGIPVSQSSVMDDIEEWLCADVKGEEAEEGVTSKEFDKFLEERAKSADKALPSAPAGGPRPPASTSSSNRRTTQQTEDNLFAL